MRHMFFLQQFFERLPTPAFIKDNKFRYVWINREWEKFFGINERKVIGKTNKKLFGEDIHEEIDKKIIKTKRTLTYETELNGKHLVITKIPIRLGDGTYGVAGYIMDFTDKYLHELSLKNVIKVDEIMRELLLMKKFDSKDQFMLELLDRIYESTDIGEYAILKNNEILRTLIPEKVCQRAKEKDEFKEFMVDGERWFVVPFDIYKFIARVGKYNLRLAKIIYPILLSKVEKILISIENRIRTEKYYKALEKIVRVATSWKTKDLKTFLKGVLEDILEIIPEAQKGSIWLISEDRYQCVVEIGYPGVESKSFRPEKTAYGAEIFNRIKNGQKVFEITNAKELVEKSELADFLSKYGLNDEKFIPLIGVFNIGGNIIGNISLDSFTGKNFSEESKKILEYFVDLLTAFLSEKIPKVMG
ncbi:MAG: PAS domain-containing protein [Thermosipho sp. (in: Bacteria)]|nr:PAS domain-containing protein [Thermosipho sp. (in: thermotogales)]